MHESNEIMKSKVNAWNSLKFSKFMKSWNAQDFIKIMKMHEIIKIDEIHENHEITNFMKIMKFDEIGDFAEFDEILDFAEIAWIHQNHDFHKISWNAKDFMKCMKSMISWNDAWNAWIHEMMSYCKAKQSFALLMHKIWSKALLCFVNAQDGSGFVLFCTSCCVKQSKAKYLCFALLCFVCFDEIEFGCVNLEICWRLTQHEWNVQ